MDAASMKNKKRSTGIWAMRLESFVEKGEVNEWRTYRTKRKTCKRLGKGFDFCHIKLQKQLLCHKKKWWESNDDKKSVYILKNWTFEYDYYLRLLEVRHELLKQMPSNSCDNKTMTDQH